MKSTTSSLDQSCIPPKSHSHSCRSPNRQKHRKNESKTMSAAVAASLFMESVPLVSLMRSMERLGNTLSLTIHNYVRTIHQLQRFLLHERLGRSCYGSVNRTGILERLKHSIVAEDACYLDWKARQLFAKSTKLRQDRKTCP